MISFNTTPNTIDRLNNLSFTMTSNKFGIQYFIVQILNGDNQLITQLKLTPTPRNRQSVTFNIGNILRNYVDTPLVNNNTLLTTAPLFGYSLRVYEDDTSESNVVGVYYTYNSELTPVVNMLTDVGVMDASTAKTFLSTKPIKANITAKQKELLYFIHSDNNNPFDIEFTINSTVYSKSYNAGFNINILNVSLDALATSFNLNAEDIKEFTVQVKSTSKQFSKVYSYKVVKSHCNQKEVNILWDNPYCGYDSFTFLNPIETKNSDKQIFKNKEVVQSSNIITGVNKVYSKTDSSTYIVATGLLTDEEYRYISGIINSTKVFIYRAGKLIEVELIDTSKEVQQQRTNKEGGTFSIQFRSEGDLFVNDDELVIVDETEIDDFIVYSFK